MYELLDYIFHFIHLSVIFINATFWMSFKTLRIAQVTLALTLISWFGFGIYYGFGYCFLTDWHWQIKEQIGDTDLPASYIKLIMDRSTGKNWNPETIDTITLSVLIFSVSGCVIQSFRKGNRDTSSQGPSSLL